MSDTRLAEAFHQQALNCASLESPFMEQLCNLFAARLTRDLPLADRLLDWPGDLMPSAQSVPLRLSGALHALRLMGRGGLAEVYPPNRVSDDALWVAICQAMAEETTFIDRFLDSPPQTNEVRRSAALITAGHVIRDLFDLPVRLSELGASGGLNLNWDHFALETGRGQIGATTSALVLSPQWAGPLPPAARPEIVERRGVDLNPLHPERDALRLRAYLWPDQPERMALTDAALSLPPAPVDKGDAIDWLASRLPHRAGQLHMIYSTVAWQYFPAGDQARGAAMIEAAGETASVDTPLAWFQMETDGQSPGAAMVLRLWPGDLHLPLGRIDFHGRWVQFNT